jgi:hypothetical protein
LTLRDRKYILPGTEKLIVDFFRGPDRPFLTELCGKIFIDIGRAPYIEGSIHEAMVWQMRQYLNKNPVIYDLAINNTLMTLGKPP